MTAAVQALTFLFGVLAAVSFAQSCDSCTGLSAGSACVAASGTSQTLLCGVCTASASCLQCTANVDQSTCSAAPSCTTYSLVNREVTQVCGFTRVVAGDLLAYPTELKSSNGVLNINMTVRLSNWNATAFTATTRLYCLSENNRVDCSMPGPTIRVKAGDRVSLTLWNELPAETTSSKPMNVLRLPNTVNLHTHGLHVDPAVDNVAITIAPGTSHTYNYVVPDDHLPGNHWYHSHVHGASSTHVSGGMSGMLMVDDDGTLAASIPSLAALPEHVLHVMKADFCSCNSGNGPFSLKSYPYLQSLASDNAASAFHNYVQQPGFTETQVVLVNGQLQPQLRVLPGEWHKLDVVNAGGEMFLELELLGGVGTSAGAATGCRMLHLSRDGLYFRNGPRDATFVLLSPAQRVSVAIQCNNTGTYYFQTVPRNRAGSNEALFQQNLLSIVVAGAANVTAAPSWSSANVTIPYYWSDLSALPSATYAFQLGLFLNGVTAPATHWLGVGTQCPAPPNPGTALNSLGRCAYQPFQHDGSYRFAAPVCSVVEMTILTGGIDPHPIHMHVFPMQIVAYTPTGADRLSNWAQIGDWVDTLPTLAGQMTVRFRTTMVGQIMIHCHLLHHEDTGMMDRWWSGSTSSNCTATSTASMCDAYVPARAFDHPFTSEAATCVTTYVPTPSATSTQAALSLAALFIFVLANFVA